MWSPCDLTILYGRFLKKLIIVKLLLVIDARSRFARSTIPKEKWGITRSPRQAEIIFNNKQTVTASNE